MSRYGYYIEGLVVLFYMPFVNYMYEFMSNPLFGQKLYLYWV